MESGQRPLPPEDESEHKWIAEKVQAAWESRPFARTFDLIARTYGWTDDQILDLTLTRMRQVREVILEAEAEKRRQRLLDRQTDLRIVTTFLAQSEKTLKQAQKITLLPRPKERPVYANHERAVALFTGAGMEPVGGDG